LASLPSQWCVIIYYIQEDLVCVQDQLINDTRLLNSLQLMVKALEFLVLFFSFFNPLYKYTCHLPYAPVSVNDGIQNLKENTMTQRRQVLQGTGGAMIAALLTSAASGQENSIEANLTEAERANIRLIDKFCAAWEAMDLQQVTATMTEQCVYRQSQDTAPVTGHQGVINLMQPWIESSHAITYKILETFARGPVVINRRIDIYHSETNHLEWEGVGLFLIEDGLIREWQDFTMRIKRGQA